MDYISDMKTVNVHEAKTHFSRWIDLAHSGEEIVIAKAGKPFARLVPLAKPQARTPGRYHETVPPGFFDPLPEAELRAWES
jgi:prevent-host-death family protein